MALDLQGNGKCAGAFAVVLERNNSSNVFGFSDLGMRARPLPGGNQTKKGGSNGQYFIFIECLEIIVVFSLIFPFCKKETV